MFAWTSFGRVKYKDRVFDCDVYIDASGTCHERDKTLAEERFGTSHMICADELRAVLSDDAEALVIGTGQSGCAKLTEDAKQLVASRQLELYLMPTPQAIKEYNNLFFKKKTVALVHVTC